MSKNQTRRSISVSAASYLRIAELARRDGRSISGLCEDMIDDVCRRADVAPPSAESVAEAKSRLKLKLKLKRAAASRIVGGGIFTF
jgi:macrodomain Ter protein organizer (MatP/YcbG family)